MTFGTDDVVLASLRFAFGHIDDGSLINLVEGIAWCRAVNRDGGQVGTLAQVDAPHFCRALGEDVGRKLNKRHFLFLSVKDVRSCGRHHDVASPAMIAHEGSGDVFLVFGMDGVVEVPNRDDGIVIVEHNLNTRGRCLAESTEESSERLNTGMYVARLLEE